MTDLQGLLKFQCKRELLGNAKVALELLEKDHIYIKTLEKLLLEMGIEKFSESQYDYNKDRAVILSRANDGWRSLWSQLDLFEINLKRMDEKGII